jgi:outer membrane lipoprotein-sorting protein
LSFSHATGPTDQWLFLPALKRVRQITAQTRKESFVGTDLSYHDLDLLQDMPTWTEEDAASKLVGEADVDGEATYVIELRPKGDDVDYGRIQIWLDKDDLISRRTHFFEGVDDPADEPVKEIVQSDVKVVGKIPVPHRVEVRRPQRGSRTVMKVERVRFDQELEEDLFSQRTLERGER